MKLRLVIFGLLTLGVSSAQVGMPPPTVKTEGEKPPARRPAAAKPPAESKAAPGASYKDLKYPLLRPVAVPRAIRHQLPNGMKLVLIEDHETPLVRALAVIRTGTVFDPPGRAGLAALTGALLRAGGTRMKPAEQLDIELEAQGASMESAIAETTGTVALTALKETAAVSLGALRDVLTAPAFRQNRIDLAKSSLQRNISQRNNDPVELLRRELRAAVFGKDSPYSRRQEYATVGAIGRPEIVEFYRRYFFPANVTLAVAGDFDPAAMKDSIEALFADWKTQQPPVPEFPKVAEAPAPGAHLALKTDVTNSWFGVARLAPEWKDKDAAASEILTNVLGAPQARLTAMARAAKGAVTGVGAEFVSDYAHAGLLQISGLNRSTATGETVQSILEEIQRIRSTEITEEELRTARDWALIHMAISYETKAKVLTNTALLDYYGYPPDFPEQYQKALSAVTRADVLRVAKERLDPQQVTVVVVSNLTVFNKPIDPRGGEAQRIDLTIPPPKQESVKPDTASADRAKELLRRAQEASGGAAKLAAVKDLTQTLLYRLPNGAEESETDQWIAPSYLREDGVSTRVGHVIRFTDGSGGWISNGRLSGPLAGASLKQALADLMRFHVPMLLSDRVAGRTISALDEQTVEIAQGDSVASIVFDPASGLPAQVLYTSTNDQGVSLYMQEDYADYRDVAGIQLPHAVTVYQRGTKYADGIVKEYKINSGLKPEVLQRRQ